MTLLNIFNTGGVTLALSVIALALVLVFWIPCWKARNQEWGHFDHMSGKWIKEADKTKFYQPHKFWFGVAVIIIYVLVMLLVVGPDYRGVI